MDKKEYNEYEKSVSKFFEREGLNNLTVEIGEDCDHKCIICGELVGCDPWFSWRACECCGSILGGDRYHATGYNPKTKEAYCYEVCVDCIYYVEYGQLDDMQMLEIEANE